MTEHNHAEYVEGCFRCELSKDEESMVVKVVVSYEYEVAAMPEGDAYGDDWPELDRGQRIDRIAEYDGNEGTFADYIAMGAEGIEFQMFIDGEEVEL